ncbi:MAG: bifunctional UDP-N-acetylmuramoyl-tripeptide:D-alanyl-D-alanine ligase/alanine racemase [Porphyromonas sp.]|nr:bifunctional UDP-N-acetylmuramoyl-tripeptide:D-alanyl-D-alanine ligase/alanine racemase [Porphyromonas sp.]
MKGFLLSAITALFDAPLPERDQEIDILLTDSRSLTFPKRTLFVALVTGRGNGHRYIGDLYSEGVRAFVVSQPVGGDYPEATFIQVPDTLKALHTIAAERRQQLSMPILSITGSNGKTTLKELLYQLMAPHLSVGRSPRSYNSQIGVPLSLWGLEADQDLGIIEAGISQPGEMRRLQQMIRPTYGAITNIGEAHQEHFESLQQKVDEKLLLFSDCQMIFAPYDEPLIRNGIERNGWTDKTVYFSYIHPDAALYVRQIDYHHQGVSVGINLRGQERRLELPFLDRGTIDDTLLALLILSEIAPATISDLQPFARLQPITMRLEVLEGKQDTLLINDSYNSDYDSLRIALDFMKRRNTDHQPTALVLSDMVDSTRQPERLYQRVANLVNQYQIDQIYLVGEKIAAFKHLFDNYRDRYPDWNSLDRELQFADLRHHVILLKGSRTAQFDRVIENWKAQTHQTILNINLSRLTANYHQLRQRLPEGMKTISMIKANAYGAGSYEVARTLERAGTDYLAVAVVDEGKYLRDQGIRLPILVMNPELSGFRQLIWNNIEPEIFSLEMLQAFADMAERYGDGTLPIHLKWNTGMNRLGLTPDQAPRVIAILHRTQAVRVASVFTHLAVADDPAEDQFTRRQLNTLDSVHQVLEQSLGYRVEKHALNTAGAMRFPGYSSDYVRLGIGLYGLSPLGYSDLPLEPVASLTTQILQIQQVKSGDTVGYGRKGKITRPGRIGIIPIGYADGLSRHLGNGRITFGLPDGTLVPTIGNICMDTTMLDLTDAPTAETGTQVTIFDDHLPISRLATACDTITYEILSRLSSRITRRYFTE